MENAQSTTAAADLDKNYPYEAGRAALLTLPLIEDEDSGRLLSQVQDLLTQPNPLSLAAAERNVLLALDILIGLADSPADVGGLAGILAFRLRSSRLTLLKATADMLLSEYIGDRAATAQRIAKFYKDPTYLEILREFKRRHEDPRPAIIRELMEGAGSAPEHICDVGCGAADLGVAIAEEVVREEGQTVFVTRLDINSELVYGAEFQRQHSERVLVASHCADFFKLWPLPDRSQDLVVMAEVLEHAFDPEWLLREAKRVLRDNGLLLVTVPNAWHWKKVLRFLFRKRLEREFLSDHIQHFAKSTLMELLNKEGFDILSVTPFSLHSETSALFDWEPGRSIKRWLHRQYSKMPGCAWNYMALGRLRRARESPQTPAVRVSGVITFGMEIQSMSNEKAVQQTLSEGLYLLHRAAQESKTQNLNIDRAVKCALLCTLGRVISVGKNGSMTLESWLQGIDPSGWSKGILELLEANQKSADGTIRPEWEMVSREAAAVWG